MDEQTRATGLLDGQVGRTIAALFLYQIPASGLPCVA